MWASVRVCVCVCDCAVLVPISEELELLSLLAVDNNDKWKTNISQSSSKKPNIHNSLTQTLVIYNISVIHEFIYYINHYCFTI